MTSFVRSFWFALTLLLGTSAGCGEPSPDVAIVIRISPEAPAVDDLALRLTVTGCDRVALDERFTANAGPSREARIGPGLPFFVWVRGYRPCEGVCVEPDQAMSGTCECRASAPSEQVTAEACSDWTDAEGEVQLNLTLAPVAGFCPPPRSACP